MKPKPLHSGEGFYNSGDGPHGVDGVVEFDIDKIDLKLIRCPYLRAPNCPLSADVNSGSKLSPRDVELLSKVIVRLVEWLWYGGRPFCKRTFVDRATAMCWSMLPELRGMNQREFKRRMRLNHKFHVDRKYFNEAIKKFRKEFQMRTPNMREGEKHRKAGSGKNI